ncbi:hypothetical protein ACFL20_05985 [Spirochaetota bacterium]
MKILVLKLIIFAAILTGCNIDNNSNHEFSSVSILDANPTSITYGNYILPVDYKGKVSAWYFGHST